MFTWCGETGGEGGGGEARRSISLGSFKCGYGVVWGYDMEVGGGTVEILTRCMVWSTELSVSTSVVLLPPNGDSI